MGALASHADAVIAECTQREQVPKVEPLDRPERLLAALGVDQSRLPIEVFDGFRRQLAANRAQFYRDVASGPFYSYNRKKHCEEDAFSNPDNITVMSIDNLPGELPRDASGDFGRQLIDNVLHDLFTGNNSPMIQRATITSGGKIEPQYGHLSGWVWPEGEGS